MKFRIVLVAIAVAVAAAIAVAVYYSRSERDSLDQSASSDRIKIEMRAMPTATITVDGKKVGKTPLSLQFPRSSRQIVVEATLVRHLVKRGGTKDEIYKDKRTVTLDRDQLLDFTFKTATRVEVKTSESEPGSPP